MKRGILFACALVTISSADVRAQDEGISLTREESASLKTIDLNELAAKLAAYEGKIVKLRFTSRSEKSTSMPDGKLRCSLFYYRNRPDPYKKGVTTTNGGLLAFIPPAGQEWFLNLTTVYTSQAPIHVIARVSKGAAGQPQGELLGREIRTDAKGSRIVW